ncbi:MucBP domain-containing protein [Peptostreptococcus porci]|uniref:MucBP domain-containing protein n=1 Tax=Peptostreptococcus porci TaxID=2652282 RepID=UPI002A908B07|nr:MucBP domain-containing protein [Peptostreptococcus porci]MDY6231952.1 MucBP domain-containing protein [Peptostreptococcus porci]
MRNNRFKTSESKQRFSIRKCNVGVVSVLLGLSFAFIAGNQVASADEVANTEAPAAIVENAPEESAATAAEPEASVAAPETSTGEAKPEAVAAPETATTASAPEATAEPKAATGETAPAAEATATAPTNAGETDLDKNAGVWKETNKETDPVLNKDDAANKATITAQDQTAPEGFAFDPNENRFTYLIYNLSGDNGSFNPSAGTNWYMTLSRDRENYDGKVYVNLVDKDANNQIIESLVVSPGDIKSFSAILNKVKDDSFTGNKDFTFQISVGSGTFENNGKPITYYFPNIQSGVGGESRNTIVYSSSNQKDIGTKINNLGTIVPFSPMEQETSYILKETKYRPESILAEYINSGGIFGDKYTIPGAADFDKYELIEKPKVESGDLKNVTVGTYQIQGNTGAKTAIVKLNTKEDGTQKIMTFVINPDHPDFVTNYDKPIDGDTLELERVQEILEDSNLSDSEKSAKFNASNPKYLMMFITKDLAPGELNDSSDAFSNKSEWSHKVNTPLEKIEAGTAQRYKTETLSGKLGVFDYPQLNIHGDSAAWLFGASYFVNINGKEYRFGGVEQGLMNRNTPLESKAKYYYAEKGGVKVYYVDTKGNVIKESVIINNHSVSGTDYDTSKVKEDKIEFGGETYYYKEIDNNDLNPAVKAPNDDDKRFVEKITAENGKIKTDTLSELTYVYEKAGGVNVHYVNEEGEEIKDPVVDEKDAKPGTKYNTEDKKEGTITTKDGKTYEYKEVKNGSDAEDGDIESGKDKKVTYVYKEIKGNVIVHYQDEEGNPLEGVDENSKDVPNTVTDTEMTSTGTEYNTTDHKPNTITTKDGKTYELVPESTIGKETGKVEPKTIEVVYVYREVKGDVIVKYFDEEGNPLEGVDENNKAVPNTVTDTPSSSLGTEYNTTDHKPNTITTKDGKTYELIPERTVDPETGKVVRGTTEVKYYYKEVKGDVIVKYFDEEGNPLEGVDENNKAVPNTVTDTPSTSTGTEYNTTDNKPKTITTKDGKTYELIPERTVDPETGKVVRGTTEVKYYYKEVKGDVVVYYEDENGNRLEGVDENSNPVNKTAVDTPLSSTGTDYDTTDKRPKEITTKDGQKYVLVPEKTDGTEKGKVVPGTTEVTYVYKKYVAPKPPTPIDPLTPYIPGSGDPGTPNPGTPDPSNPNPGTPNPGTPDPSNPNPGTPNPNTPDSNKPNGNGNRTPGNNGGRYNYRKVVKNNKKDVDKLPQMGNEDTNNFAAIGAVALASAIGVAATSKRKEEN